ncbi:hypothetical protein [Paenibacillus silvae]|uniref:hypothetical protein n=1 Tax=Paenibacillus silvae TaxID=1325358 RepID=UPI0011B85CE1|nr:hypothetical protein [Paenibacillus silvae]
MDTEKWAGADNLLLFDSGQVGWNRGNSSRPYVCISGVGRGLFIMDWTSSTLVNKPTEKEHDYEFSADDLDAAAILGRA